MKCSVVEDMIFKCGCKQETGIFARMAMVDQAREGLCCQKETKLKVDMHRNF